MKKSTMKKQIRVQTQVRAGLENTCERCKQMCPSNHGIRAMCIERCKQLYCQDAG